MHYFCYAYKYRPSCNRNLCWFMHETLLLQLENVAAHVVYGVQSKSFFNVGE
jgi:hypothetical protein